jgi:DNA-binding Lrp family transcriptional regulator
VKVGEVCGYEVHARRTVVEQAARFQEALGKDRWPGDALLATIMALRIGIKPTPTYREIARMLNMSERHVLRIAKRGKKDQVVERELNRLDREGLPMAVENVLEGLQERDKDYTLEYLKGRGVFRQKHETVQDPNAVAAFTGLVVQFVHDGSAAEIKAGAIIANPNRALAPVPAAVRTPDSRE